MNGDTLRAAIHEADRFLARARAALKLIGDDRDYFPSSKETAAARRASMDLTRALADIRRPG